MARTSQPRATASSRLRAAVRGIDGREPCGGGQRRGAIEFRACDLSDLGRIAPMVKALRADFGPCTARQQRRIRLGRHSEQHAR